MPTIDRARKCLLLANWILLQGPEGINTVDACNGKKVEDLTNFFLDIPESIVDLNLERFRTPNPEER